MEALALRPVAAVERERAWRIGLFAASPCQPRWAVEAFARVAASDSAQIVALGQARESRPGKPWLWSAYEWLDRLAFARGPDESEGVDLAKHIPAVHALVLPRADDPIERWATFEASVRALDLDVAFALGDVDLARLAPLTHHGAWRFGFGAALEAREPGVEEVLENQRLSSIGLVAHGPDGERRVLCQSWSRTFPFSIARNHDELARKAAQLPLRALRDLAEPADAPAACEAPPATRPGSPRRAAALLGLGTRLAGRAMQKALYVDQWFLAFAFGEAGHDPADLRRFVPLVPPKDRYWADPFPWVRGGRCYIFFEELMFDSGRAHIAVVEVDRSGRASDVQRVLQTDYHLSYPFLIEEEGQLYMIPETAAANRVEAWRCVEFPHRWVREKVLMDGVRAVDATFHRDAGRLWMFANVAPPGASLDDELHLFQADRLLGEWRPHRRNPVKSDVRCARPAGRLFRREGALYRPAQVCVPLYGAGLAIHRVEALTPEDYRESLAEVIVPRHPAGLLGLHTLNRAGDLCVVDGFMRRPRFARAESEVPLTDTAIA